MLKRIFLILFTFIIIFSIYPNQANAIGNIIQGGDNFLNVGSRENNMIDGEALQAVSNTVFNILLAISIVLAVIIGAVIGIRYMTASVEGQAKIKESLVPFMVGCAVIFGAFGIWKLVVTIGYRLLN